MRITIAKKIFLAFLLILSLSFLVAGIGFYGLLRVKKTTSRALYLGFEFHERVQRMKNSLLEARKDEKNFLLSGKQQYVSQFEREIKSITKVSEEVISLKLLPGSEEQISLVASFADDYRNGFLTVVSKTMEKGDGDRGLTAELARSTNQLEKQVYQTRDQQILIDFLNIRGVERDYRIKREAQYIGRMEGMLSKFKQNIKKARLPQSRKDKLLKNVDQYWRLFIKTVVIDAGVERLRGVYNDTAARFEQMLERLSNSSHALQLSSVAKVKDVVGKTTLSVFIILGLTLTFGVGFSIFTPKRMVKSLANLARATHEISQGDLSRRVEVTNRDEVGDLAHAFNRMIENLKELVTRVKEAGLSMSSFAGEILAASRQQSTGAAEQAAAVEQVTVSIEELSRTAGQIAENTRSVVSAAEETLKSVEMGQKAVTDSIQKMEEIKARTDVNSEKIRALGEKSQQIGEVLTIINEIAAETKMLSLNAAIEAAKAGEAGKGFSVVAGEIRKLAEKVVSSTATIGEIISEIQSSVNESVMATGENVKGVEAQALLVQRVGESLRKILHMAERTAESAQQISVATEQQEAGSEQVVNSMKEISDVSQQSAASAKQATVSAEELNSLAEQLKLAVAKFNLDGLN